MRWICKMLRTLGHIAITTLVWIIIAIVSILTPTTALPGPAPITEVPGLLAAISDPSNAGRPHLFFLKILFIYLFLERKGKGGRERGRETSMCGCLSCAPHWGPGRQPRHVPQLGTKPATPWFAGRHSIHWATSARAGHIYLQNYYFFKWC